MKITWLRSWQEHYLVRFNQAKYSGLSKRKSWLGLGERNTWLGLITRNNWLSLIERKYLFRREYTF